MASSTPISRRRFGRHVLLGGGAVAGVLATRTPAEAAPGTDPWRLGGNSISNDGTNFLGTRNVAPLIFKTAPAANTPTERMRITPNGNVAIGLAGPTSRLHVRSPKADAPAILGVGPNSISNALNAMGIKGEGTVGVQGIGEYMGVQGNSLNYGVFGYTSPDTGGMGVYGRGGIGVKGRSYTGSAVLGDTDSGTGVKGESYSGGGGVKAVWGLGYGENNNGIVGEASNGSVAYGVWGISTTGYAGVFSGKVLVTGSLSKGSGSFKIDHPLDPENKYLYHSFVESPDMMNVYNGNVTTDARGEAVVELPAYFEALNRDFRYQLTVIGAFAQAIVAKKVRDNRFTIRTDKPRVEVSWQVTGIRQDAFANAERIPVEVDKPEDERGTLLHPSAHGKPASRGAHVERIRAMHARSQPRQVDISPRG